MKRYFYLISKYRSSFTYKLSTLGNFVWVIRKETSRAKWKKQRHICVYDGTNNKTSVNTNVITDENRLFSSSFILPTL